MSLDLSEEARRERDADVDAYHAWQGRYSAWLRTPDGQPNPTDRRPGARTPPFKERDHATPPRVPSPALPEVW